MTNIGITKSIVNMAHIDCRKVFDVGAKVTLSQRIVDNFNPKYIFAPAWEKDCIDAQNSEDGLVVTHVYDEFIVVKGASEHHIVAIASLNLNQLEKYIYRPEILYAFADNQDRRGKLRNICEDLSTAFRWIETPEGEGFWGDILLGREVEYPNIKESQQTNQNTNNHEIRLQKQKSLSPIEEDQKELEFALQNTKLQFEADKLATQRAICEKKDKLASLKFDYPIDIQAIITAQEDLKNFEDGLNAIEELQKELGLN